MRVALISDVHGNLPALRAVLDDIERCAVSEIWCLGDVVGYGAQPNECIELVAERCSRWLAGNHDLVVCGTLAITEFSAHARAAAEWTREVLDPAGRALLSARLPFDLSGPVGLWHASPRDPVWEYVLSVPQAAECLAAMNFRIGCIGHSHVALFFTALGDNGEGTTGAVTEPDRELALSEGCWLLNPGSVGQPRDSDPRASWLLLDLERLTAVWRRVEYPVDEAAAAIVAAGLPPLLAERLWTGT
ncbi:hypothetical protein HRbin41_01502 [bacterium HR41]|nr:hypothetical protein HRbin41_01502 [bacterium HR41]